MKKNEKGFTHLGLFLLIIMVISIVGLAGWIVYSKNKTTPVASTITNKTSTQKETTTNQEEPKVPDNYIVYENTDIGFKFAYPREWGTIVRTGDDTDTLRTDGLNGRALRTVFKDGDTKVLPHGYGLNGDTAAYNDEGFYGGGYIQKEDKYYSRAKYSNEEFQIPTQDIKAEVSSGLGTVLVVKATTIAGTRTQLLLNLPEGKSLNGLSLILKNSNEDFADEGDIDAKGLETLQTVAKTFDTL